MLVELADLRSRVGQPSSITVEDPLLTALEAESVQWVETQTGRPIAWAEDTVEELNGTGDRGPLRLPYEVTQPDTAPTAIASSDIEVRTRDDVADDFGDPLETTAYRIRWDSLRFTHVLTRIDGGVWPRGNQTVQVTFSGAGWGLGEDEPRPRADISGLVLELVVKRFRERSLVNQTTDRRDDPSWKLSPFAAGVLHRYLHVYGRQRASSRAVTR